MVQLITNVPEYYNDLAEEIRLYLPSEQVAECGVGECDVVVEARIFDGADEWRAECRAAGFGRSASYEISRKRAGDSELEIKRYRKWLIKVAVFRALGRLIEKKMPWGSLTGIRPTRLLRELRAIMPAEAANSMMTDTFDVEAEKLSLVTEILSAQEPILATGRENDVDIYVGIPFCKTLCLYCSFPSSLRTSKTDMEPYIDALLRDVAHGAKLAAENGLNVRSVYVGGGTPTVLTGDELDRVLGFVCDAYGGFGLEFTVEAGRPDTISVGKLRVMKAHGVNRISVNPQTMEPRTLSLIGRSHTADDVRRAFSEAREVGFDSINMDMICGLPGENSDDVSRTLDALIAMEPENITVHTLAVKRSSRLRDTLECYPMPSSETVDAMVGGCRKTLALAGFYPYYMYRQKYMAGNLENVGYTVKGAECVYNVDMMEETVSILAHGAGAMSKRIFGGEHRVERIPNPKNIARYIEKLPQLFEDKDKLFRGV